MATIRDFFDTDAAQWSMSNKWKYSFPNGTEIEGIAKIIWDLWGNSKYWHVYIPTNDYLFECLSMIFELPGFDSCEFGPEGNGVCKDVQVEFSFKGDAGKLTSNTLQFTRRIHLYLDFNINKHDESVIDKIYRNLGYFVSIHDREYARIRSEKQKPLAFISHDYRDKEIFVRDLVSELSKNNCSVWYDEFSLNIGDSLRACIERGLRETKKCVIILSPNFLSNEGWGKAEFDSIFTREIIEKKNIILPVWLDVDIKDVYDYSPRLADKVGISSNLGVEEVARRLAKTIKKND